VEIEANISDRRQHRVRRRYVLMADWSTLSPRLAFFGTFLIGPFVDWLQFYVRSSTTTVTDRVSNERRYCRPLLKPASWHASMQHD